MAYVGSFPISPTLVTGGAIAVYENIWENHKETIDSIKNITSETDSKIKFVPSQTNADISTKNSLHQSIRTSDSLNLTHAAKVNNEMRKINNACYELISSALQNYREKFKIEHKILDAETYGILKYSKGNQYKQHYDGGTDSSRSVSVLIYLNDDYEGGEIEFINFNEKIKPKAGTMILFPSNYAYLHAAHPVTSGEKYVVVTWLHDR
jgi:predicted 2-oxoglutarate/Fe(II)-dependent dioxygenase YbiX